MAQETDLIIVFITAPTIEDGERLAEIIVSARLAACVNVVPGISSFFHWQGNLERADEVLLMAKSRISQFDALRRRIRKDHSYETPEIIALPIVIGDEDYLAWVDETMTQDQDRAG